MCHEVDLCITSLLIYILYSTREWPIALDMACNKALSSVACTFEFTNMATEDYHILTSDSPLEGLYSPFVAVYHNGRRVQYEGLIGFRLAPRKQDFQLIKAGQVISVTVQISDAFTFGSDGLYIIRYNKPLRFITRKEMDLQVEANNIKQMAQVEVSESISIYLEDTHLLQHPVKPVTSKPDRIVHVESCNTANFIGGTETQQNNTRDAHVRLCNGFINARAAVGDNTRTTTWFGAYDAGRATTARNALQKCSDGLRDNAVTYDFVNGKKICNSKRRVIAFTRGGSTTVWLCGSNGYDATKQFCNAARSSKERILAHEWSHAFSRTKDYAYRPANCQALARDNPAQALDNADSYALFYCNGLL